MVLSILPGVITSEIRVGNWSFPSERIVGIYMTFVAAFFAVYGGIEARKRIGEAFQLRNMGRLLLEVIVWTYALAICGIMLWGMLRYFLQ